MQLVFYTITVPSESMKRALWRLLPLLGLILFVYVLANAGIAQTWDILKSFNPLYLLFAPIFVVASLLLKGWKWKLLLNACNQDLPLWSSIKIWTIGFFASIITPGKAGDVIRAFYVKKTNNVGLAESVTSIILERIIDIVTLLTLTVISIFLLVKRYQYDLSFANMIVLIVLIIVAFYVFTKKKWMMPIIRKLTRILPRRYRRGIIQNIGRLYSSIELVKHDWKRLIFITFITFVLWGVLFYYVKLLSDGMGLHLDFLFVFMLLPIVTFIELIPISVSGLGTREAAMVVFFSLIGLSASHAVSFSLVYLFLGSWLTGIIGFIFWMRHPISMNIDLKSLDSKSKSKS